MDLVTKTIQIIESAMDQWGNFINCEGEVEIDEYSLIESAVISLQMDSEDVVQNLLSHPRIQQALHDLNVAVTESAVDAALYQGNQLHYHGLKINDFI